jgi:hypothetical protein
MIVELMALAFIGALEYRVKGLSTSPREGRMVGTPMRVSGGFTSP